MDYPVNGAAARPPRRSLSFLCSTTALLALCGCGTPEPPNIRQKVAESVNTLSMRPIYPFSETLRIGALHIVDASAAKPGDKTPIWQETSLLLTEELVPAFEQARQNRPSLKTRFPRSHADLGSALRPAAGQVFYRQQPAAKDDPAPPADSLALAAIPGYTLASVDQGTLGGFLPGLAATFFGSLGLRHTSYLRMEPEGVEMAEVPYDQVRQIVYNACSDTTGRSLFGNIGENGKGLVRGAYQILDQLRQERGDTQQVQPQLVLMRRIFYLRGVRFVTDDSRVSAAFLQAALQSSLQGGQTPVSLPSLPAKNNLAPAGEKNGTAGTAQGAAAQNAAAITALQEQIDQLRAALASGSGPQLGASFARAAATGVELVQLFDRPLAFGYQAYFVDVRANDLNRPAGPTNPMDLSRLCKSI